MECPNCGCMTSEAEEYIPPGDKDGARTVLDDSED